MSVVISFLTSLLFIACLIYVPICAIVALARSLADPGDGKIARGEEWVGKLFSWRCLLWAVYALFILFCMGSADCHPVHDGMTEAESKILCWKALLSCLDLMRDSSCLVFRSGFRDSAQPMLSFLCSFCCLPRCWRYSGSGDLRCMALLSSFCSGLCWRRVIYGIGNKMSSGVCAD